MKREEKKRKFNPKAIFLYECSRYARINVNDKDAKSFIFSVPTFPILFCFMLSLYLWVLGCFSKNWQSE